MEGTLTVAKRSDDTSDFYAVITKSNGLRLVSLQNYLLAMKRHTSQEEIEAFTSSHKPHIIQRTALHDPIGTWVHVFSNNSTKEAFFQQSVVEKVFFSVKNP